MYLTSVSFSHNLSFAKDKPNKGTSKCTRLQYVLKSHRKALITQT